MWNCPAWHWWLVPAKLPAEATPVGVLAVTHTAHTGGVLWVVGMFSAFMATTKVWRTASKTGWRVQIRRVGTNTWQNVDVQDNVFFVGSQFTLRLSFSGTSGENYEARVRFAPVTAWFPTQNFRDND